MKTLLAAVLLTISPILNAASHDPEPVSFLASQPWELNILLPDAPTPFDGGYSGSLIQFANVQLTPLADSLPPESEVNATFGGAIGFLVNDILAYEAPIVGAISDTDRINFIAPIADTLGLFEGVFSANGQAMGGRLTGLLDNGAQLDGAWVATVVSLPTAALLFVSALGVGFVAVRAKV